MCESYYTGSLTPNSGSGGSVTVDSALSATSENPVQNKVITVALSNKQDTDPNEIPAGTVIEGKFSDLPTFFAGLEGKYCNGTVTYKITEDETLTNLVQTQIKVPMNIIIDGNNKTITNNITLDYKGVSFSFTENGNFSSLRIMNVNFVGQGKTSTYMLQGISFLYPNNGVYVENCTFSNFSFAGINTTSANVNCDDCAFSNSTEGFYSSRGSNNLCINSSFNNITRAFSIEKGSIVRSYNNTYTTVGTTYNTFNDSKTIGTLYIYNG